MEPKGADVGRGACPRRTSLDPVELNTALRSETTSLDVPLVVVVGAIGVGTSSLSKDITKGRQNSPVVMPARAISVVHAYEGPDFRYVAQHSKSI